MIRFVSRGEVDDDRWNQCVLSDPDFRHYALTYYLDAAAAEWEAIIVDDYECVWPLPVKRPLLRLYQPLLTQQLGPYGRALAVDEWKSIVRHLRRRYWRLTIKFNDQLSAVPFDRVMSHRNIERSLHQTFEALRACYNRSVQTNLRKAESAQLEVNCVQDYVPELVSMFQSGKGEALKTLTPVFYTQVEAIYKAFAEKGEAETWLVKKDEHVVAGIMLLKSGNRLLNFFTANSPQARATGAMHLAFDSIIRSYAESAYVLDFEGSDDENLAFFYRSFGGDEKVYLQVDEPWGIPWMRRTH